MYETGHQLWRVTANVSNKQWQAADKWWYSRVGVWASDPTFRNVTQGLGLGLIVWEDLRN